MGVEYQEWKSEERIKVFNGKREGRRHLERPRSRRRIRRGYRINSGNED
jgi:hypothetical protein